MSEQTQKKYIYLLKIVITKKKKFKFSLCVNLYVGRC